MTLAADELIRRFLMNVVPKDFHRIRHYGLLANGNRAGLADIGLFQRHREQLASGLATEMGCGW